MDPDLPAEPKPSSKLVLFIQGLISFLAPPLHSLHWKIFLLCLAAIFLPGLYFAWKVGQGIERSHMRSTEQGMIDTALVLAESVSGNSLGDLPASRETLRTVFGDQNPNLRVVFYTQEGKVLHDTAGIYQTGEDRSADRDVRKAMRGDYGARWERDSYRRVVVLFSTLPIMKNGQREGLISVIKTTADVRKSVIRSLKDLAVPAILALLLAALVSFVLSTYLTGILKNLAERAGRVATGESGVALETWSKSELGTLARALEKMRRRLEGKKYVEEMALTLSHEIKTPIAAIRGAAEILENSPEPAVKSKFLGSIFAETERLSLIVDNFLALSRIENAPTDPTARACLSEVAAEVAGVFLRRAGGVDFQIRLDPGPSWVAMPPEALRRMMEAILENALQFTPAGKSVVFTTGPDWFCVEDQGPGIPADLQSKIFDRFFTTVNPLTGRRGTGLGLSIVKSIADRYGAKLEVTCDSGTRITVRLTTPSSRHNEVGKPS
jgi:two-component system sensor histidine kinase CreC